MSDAPWQSRTLVPPFARPEVMIGAASPLWGYYAGAALAGMGWWWLSRWAPPHNFERLAALPVESAVAAVAGTVGGPVAKQLVADEVAPAPVGGESAPVPVVALEAEPSPEPEPAKAPEIAKPVQAVKEPEPGKEPELAATPPDAPSAPAPRARKVREAEPKPH